MKWEGKKFLSPSVGEQKNLETKFRTQFLELLTFKDSKGLADLQALVPCGPLECSGISRYEAQSLSSDEQEENVWNSGDPLQYLLAIPYLILSEEEITRLRLLERESELHH